MTKDESTTYTPAKGMRHALFDQGAFNVFVETEFQAPGLGGELSVYIGFRNHQNTAVLKPLTFEILDATGSISGAKVDPTLIGSSSFIESFFKAMVEAAYEQGIVAKDHRNVIAGLKGELAAKNSHLEDLRTLLAIDRMRDVNLDKVSTNIEDD